ncbi:protease inhibitor I9 family protein, partial [Gorillibacterium massiliense]|uniref:protease inhibitor I9 family protein n=1 Tax=Gorillibacterium massiliense TaxID=1280390 RepID=UPI000593655B
MFVGQSRRKMRWVSIFLVIAVFFSLALPAYAADSSSGASVSSQQPRINLSNVAFPTTDVSQLKEPEAKEPVGDAEKKDLATYESVADGKALLKTTESSKAINYVPDSDSSGPIKVIVELSNEPIAVHKIKAQTSRISGGLTQEQLIATEQASFSAAAKKLSVTLNRKYDQVFNGYSVTIKANQVDRLLTLPGVKAVYPDVQVKATPITSITPNMDESAPFIGSHAYWDSGHSGAGIKVGVIDTGIDYLHPSLKDAYKGGYDFVDNDNDPYETRPDPND